jgi:hypothetical protein
VKRRIQGLNETGGASAEEVPDGMFLVRVDRAQYRWHPQKPFYALRLSIVEPREWAGNSISGRLYCTSKALWKLGWFLRDFAYDPELLGRDEADEKAMAGLRGIVKISRTVVNGRSLLNLDGFAPASQWEELRISTPEPAHTPGAAK